MNAQVITSGIDFGLAAKFADDLAAIVTAAVTNAGENREEKSHAEERGKTLAARLRDYATHTEAANVEPESAAVILRVQLQNVMDGEGKALIPGGTVKNYVSAFKGYRKLLAAGKPIEGVNTAAANAEMASETKVQKDAIMKRFRAVTKDFTNAQWEALTSQLEAEAKAAAEVTAAEGEAIEGAAAAPRKAAA